MEFVPSLEKLLPFSDPLSKLAYQGLQNTIGAFSLGHKNIAEKVMATFTPQRKSAPAPLSPEIIQTLQKSRQQLLDRDWEDAQTGVYPTEALFDTPWDEIARYYPLLWWDLPRTWERSAQQKYRELPGEIDRRHYPQYYLRNFHYQTDGYLSDYSANLYDLGVEILFNGTANPMRRRILAPLKQSLARFQSLPPQGMRVLDLACGTGYTLKSLRATFPNASLFGVDLSPAYLRKANQILSSLPGELPQLCQSNAETLPFVDNYFHALTCVFLFHELPAPVRQKVINEAFRVIQPGGVFVICDSLQALDRPDLLPIMEFFPALFHEPYYRHYINDDLVVRLQQAGFQDIKIENHYVSKYWIAHKPD